MGPGWSQEELITPHSCREHLPPNFHPSLSQGTPPPHRHSSGWVKSCSPSRGPLQERASGGQEMQQEPNALPENRSDAARPGHLCASAACRRPQADTRSCSKLCRQLTGLPVSLRSPSSSSEKGSQLVRGTASPLQHPCPQQMPFLDQNPEPSMNPLHSDSRWPPPTSRHWLLK